MLHANGRNIVGCYALRPSETGLTFEATIPNISFVSWIAET